MQVQLDHFLCLLDQLSVFLAIGTALGYHASNARVLVCFEHDGFWKGLEHAGHCGGWCTHIEGHMDRCPARVVAATHRCWIRLDQDGYHLRVGSIGQCIMHRKALKGIFLQTCFLILFHQIGNDGRIGILATGAVQWQSMKRGLFFGETGRISFHQGLDTTEGSICHQSFMNRIYFGVGPSIEQPFTVGRFSGLFGKLFGQFRCQGPLSTGDCSAEI